MGRGRKLLIGGGGGSPSVTLSWVRSPFRSSKDAVKKGDKSILDTIGNLYQKIKLTTKDVNDSEMMDDGFYG